MLCLSMTTFATPPQDGGHTVSGKVTDDVSKTGVPGVAVTIKGTSIGQITDIDGMYSIVVPNNETVLVFSSLGYEEQEIVVGTRTNIDIVLQEASFEVDEAVVIAYGTLNKGLVTSAISSIGTNDLVKSPAANITNALAGAMPGVSSVQTTGQPGKDDATLYVRGNGSLSSSLSAPLVLVDGIEGRTLSQIDPNEIESISVLKDASSTAVFGVRGANGVILVTTRRGSEGKPTIAVTASLGAQQPISLVKQTNSFQYARFWNMRQQMDGAATGYFTPEQIEAYRTGSDPIMYPSIDWMDYMFNDIFLQSKNNINISGGSDAVKYFVSMGYLYQNGLMKELPGQTYDNNYRYNRYNYRANIDARLSPTTTLKVGMGGYVGKTQQPIGASTNNNSVEDPWIIVQTWTTPWAGPGFVNGVRTLAPSGSDIIPVNERRRDGMFAFYGLGYRQLYNTTLNLDAEITQKLDVITPGLSISIKGAYDNTFSIQKNRSGGNTEWQTVWYKSDFDAQFNGMPHLDATDPDFDKTYVFRPEGGSISPLSYSESNGRGQSWYIEGRINYERTFNEDHRVSALFLYNQSRKYYPATYTYIPRGYIGFVGRATYGYRNKYLFDVNFGYNGSENFAPGSTRYGLFPAFSLGWVASEEGFMSRQEIFSYLKFRVSWGRVGNDSGGTRFAYAPTTWNSTGGYSFGVDNPTLTPGYGMGTEGNPLVTWETSDKQNYGIDAKFLYDRLTLTADYFREHRTGILITPNSRPNIVSITWPMMNIGVVDNHGYELALGWRDRADKGFDYYVNANVSYARNKLVYFDEVANAEPYMNFTGGSTGPYERTRIGGINTSGFDGRYYKFERLYQYSDFIENADGTLTLKPDYPVPSFDVQPGDAMYADLNGDNMVDANDRFVTGYGDNPEYTFGLNAGFNWKGLSFSMQWVGATHVDRVFAQDMRHPMTNHHDRGLLTYFYDGCWSYENQENAVYPRPSYANGARNQWNYEYMSTLWLKDASYLRLKCLNLGYTLSSGGLEKVGVKSLGMTFSAYNLLTFTSLKYMDPESKPTNQGDYPLVKLYTLGVNINF